MAHLRATTHVVIRRNPTTGLWWWVCIAETCTEGEGHGTAYPAASDALTAALEHLQAAAAVAGERAA